MPKTYTIPIQNGELEVIRFGLGKQPLVILPGLSYDGLLPQAKAIARAYRLFADAFDVCLIDRNKTPHKGYTVREIADDTAEVMRKLQLENACVFGASLGGMAAQELAIRHPELVQKLALGSTLSRPNATATAVLARWERLAGAGEIARLTADFQTAIYSPETLQKYAAVFAAMPVEATPEKTARFLIYLAAAKHFDVLDSLGKVRAKTLVIGSAGDRVTTAAAARETATALGCRYYEYQTFGHAVFDEAPDYKQLLLEHFTTD